MTIRSIHLQERSSRGVMRCARCWVLAVSLIAMTGCGQPLAPVFEPLGTPLFWPNPPEPARIHYVGQISSSDDLKAKHTFGEFLFGADDDNAMLSPYAMCTDGAGRLFVSDSNGQVVHMYDLNTRRYERWIVPKERNAFSQPVGIAYDSLGRVLVTDSVAGTIFAFDESGQYLGELGAAHLARPCGIAVDPRRELLYVADTGAHQIVVLSYRGELIERIGERGIGEGQFNYPTNVALDREGMLYVSDSLNCRVLVFDQSYQQIMQIGRRGDLPGYFMQPKGLAIDDEGHVYVVDAQFEAVQIFDRNGTLLLMFGEEGHGPGQFWLPAGIHIDPMNRIWIADTYNRRVQVFDYRPEVTP